MCLLCTYLPHDTLRAYSTHPMPQHTLCAYFAHPCLITPSAPTTRTLRPIIPLHPPRLRCTGNEEQRMRALAKAADALSAGDTINTALRKTNSWSLAPAALVQMGLVGASLFKDSRIGTGVWEIGPDGCFS